MPHIAGGTRCLQQRLQVRTVEGYQSINFLCRNKLLSVLSKA